MFVCMCACLYPNYPMHEGEKTFSVEGVNLHRDWGLHVKMLSTHREPWVLLRRQSS